MSVEEDVITIDMSELKKMKVPELKKKVAELGLAVKGTKAELLARVEKYLNEQEDELLVEEVEGEEEEEVVEGEEGDGEDAEGEGEGVEGEDVEGGEEVPTESVAEEVKFATTSEQVQVEITNVGEEPSAKEVLPVVVNKAKVLTKVDTSPAERIAQRAARFGVNSSVDAKKVARAERFGTSLENGYQGLGKREPSGLELEKMKKRADRFGSSVSPAIASVEETDKKQKRLGRFGQGITELSEEERKKARASKFGAS